MEFPDIFLEYSKLLSYYKGVEITDTHKLKDRFIVTLRISDPKSMVSLDYFCYAANTHSSCYAENCAEDEESTGESLRRIVWYFMFRCDENIDGLSEDLKCYCCFMVWDLQKRKKISKSEATRLLSIFGGAQRE